MKFKSFTINLFFKALILTLLFHGHLKAVYIERYNTTDNGSIVFTGNTLGLSKVINQHNPGKEDSAGAFITVDTSQKVNLYPAGTTLDWTKNSSAAVLDLPDESTILYAELIWSGSYGFQNQITIDDINAPVILTTPEGVSHFIPSDPATRQQALTPGYQAAGNYVRSAAVTSIIQASGAGTYTVGGVPGTISALDNTHNAAGWTLAVVFRNGQMLTNNMTIFVGCEQASYNTNQPASVTGFCVPPSGEISGTLFVSAIEGDANKTGDRMLFGGQLPLTLAANSLVGVNNPINNFFCSQINTLQPFRFVDDGKILRSGSGQLDTRGTFGDRNADPFTATIHPGDRQSYDITSIDVSDKLSFNQTQAYALGTTTGDDYTINALGIQIQVGAPIIKSVKSVNNSDSVVAEVGDVVNFKVDLSNEGTADAFSVIFRDELETGLSLVPGSVKLNGVTLIPDPDLAVGFSIGTLVAPTPTSPGGQATVEFQARINNYPLSNNIFYNNSNIDYNFISCIGNPIRLTSQTNIVSIVLPSSNIPLIQATKLVNSEESITARIGETISYSVHLQNVGTGSALSVVFKDPLPPGLSFVPNSFLINNIIVSPDPDLSAGVLIGDLNNANSDEDLGSSSADIEFKVLISSYPATGNSYSNISVIDYEYMPFENIFRPLTTSSNSVFTFIETVPPPPSPLLPPKHFKGRLKKCELLNRNRYSLKLTWDPPSSNDVIYYVLYLNNKQIAKIPTSKHPVYKTCLNSKKKSHQFAITAMYPNQQESKQVKVRIVND